MNLTEKRFKVTGVFPLLMNNPSTMSDSSSTEIKSKKKKYDPKEEAEIRLYKNDDGTYYIPSFAFRSALLDGLKGKKIGKVGAATVIKPAVFNADEKTTVLDPGTMKPQKEYKIDSRRAIVQRAGIIRHRPKFEKWGAIVTLLIDETVISAEQLAEHLDIAGTTIGVGDFRIARGGPFGSFKAEVCEDKK